MKIANWLRWFWKLWIFVSLVFGGETVVGVNSVLANDIKPDETLGNEQSVVTPLAPNLDRIEGGAMRGSNLFHSFLDFNVVNGGAAYFANPTGVDNILSRVTGDNPSHLFGTLGVLGEANLFFLNPKGIIFGRMR